MTASAVIFLDICPMARNRILGLLTVFFYIAGFVAPNHYFPWPSYHNELPSAVALAALVIWCLLSDRKLRSTTTRTVPALLATSVIPQVQAYFGLISFWGDAIVIGLYLAGTALACYSAFFLANLKNCGSQTLLEWIAWSLLIAALLSLGIVLMQLVGYEGSIWLLRVPSGGRPVANLGQPNQLATLFLVGLLSLIYLRVTRKIGEAPFIGTALLLGIGLASAQSRSVLLVYVTLAGWLAWRLPNDTPDRIRLIKFSLALLGQFAAIWFLWPHLINALSSDGMHSARSFQDPARLTGWLQMLDALSLSPLFGYGWGQVGLAQIAVADHWTTSGMLQSAHNIFLDLIIWNGLPLGLLLVAAIAIWGIKNSLKLQTTGSWYALGIVGTVLIHSMLEYPLHYTYFLFLAAAMVGVVDAELRSPEVRVNTVFLGSVASCALVTFALLVAEYPSVEAGVEKLRFRGAGAEVSEKQVRNEIVGVSVLSQMRAFIEFSLMSVREGMPQAELDVIRTVAHRFPYSSSIYLHALALAVNKQPEAARQELTILRNIHGEKSYLDARKNLLRMQEKHPQIAQALSDGG